MNKTVDSNIIEENENIKQVQRQIKKNQRMVARARTIQNIKDIITYPISIVADGINNEKERQKKQKALLQKCENQYLAYLEQANNTPRKSDVQTTIKGNKQTTTILTPSRGHFIKTTLMSGAYETPISFVYEGFAPNPETQAYEYYYIQAQKSNPLHSTFKEPIKVTTTGFKMDPQTKKIVFINQDNQNLLDLPIEIYFQKLNRDTIINKNLEAKSTAEK